MVYSVGFESLSISSQDGRMETHQKPAEKPAESISDVISLPFCYSYYYYYYYYYLFSFIRLSISQTYRMPSISVTGDVYFDFDFDSLMRAFLFMARVQGHEL